LESSTSEKPDQTATWLADHAASLHKAEQKAVIAEKHLASLRAGAEALEARIAADRARFSNPPAADAVKLGEAAQKIEQHAGMVKAEEEIFIANDELQRSQTEGKKRDAAQKRLEDALQQLTIAKEGYSTVGPVYPETSSGRRLALAKWIASTDNPLTARVAINHMWLRHFGKALEPTVFNFGKSGKSPTHAELLDWLATEFMAHHWDMKYIHRMMVTSKAYRMQSAWKADDPNLKLDPDNVHLWHMNPRRMEAENVRDSMLFLAGKLDETMGGPELDETKGQQVFRRSIYFRHSPDTEMEMLKVFDAASTVECFERSESVVPQQALALTNSSLSFTISRVMAQRLVEHAGGDGVPAAKFVAAAFLEILGRPPSATEASESVKFMEGQAEFYKTANPSATFHNGETVSVHPSGNPQQRSRESLVHVLVNHNDFVTIR